MVDAFLQHGVNINAEKTTEKITEEIPVHLDAPSGKRFQMIMKRKLQMNLPLEKKN